MEDDEFVKSLRGFTTVDPRTGIPERPLAGMKLELIAYDI